MKLSNYRGEDIRKMLLKAAACFVVLLGLILFGIYIGRKYIGKKVISVMEEAKNKKEEEELQTENLKEEDVEDFDGQIPITEKESEGKRKEEETESEESLIHRYDYIVADCTWSEAKRRCQEQGGYLVTIESREEFDFITEELERNSMGEILFYLGAGRDVENNYYWQNADGAFAGDFLNGNERNWCYDIWMQGEPSFYDGEIEENVLALFYYSNESRWVFNDVPENILEHLPYYSGKIGYICEYDE